MSLGANSGSREPDPQAVPALAGFDPERWIAHFREEAEFARGAQKAAWNPIERAYRMGQKDALLMAADDLESGARLAMINWRKA